ncbi:MAG: molecular chaperone HtpG [Candidatus Izimaplasma sp.]|nr:molecular chaperone HtpG [Candidatus Izimaplasma bacterium]
MSKTKQFKTESKKLLDLMIHSIYTHKEIFLRELISNASDAIDKRHYIALKDSEKDAEYEILIERDEENRQLKITDNGIGLTEEELITNLGTIAKSGTKEFLDRLENKDAEIIGQFGVGFYSAFMVADKVTVETKSLESDQAYRWVSDGTESYTITEIERENIGTTIVLHLRETKDEEDEKYDEFLTENKIKTLVKKYSDYVRYPIKMDVTKHDYPEDEEKDPITYTETETLNSMIPLWRKNKREITDEEYNEFYKHQFDDFTDPMRVIHTKVEGLIKYTSLLFIPKKAPFNLYSENYEKGLQLYSKGVFIMDKNKQLIPDYFRFVKGLVDSSDLSLNISREMLQSNKQLERIAKNVKKKIKSELEKMLKSERETYNEFFETYGVNLKYGIYDGFGVNKEFLQDLIMFKTTKSEEYITFKEYVDDMPDDQEFIYYATGKSKEAINSLPQMDLIKEKDYQVLLFTEDIDEFMINIMKEYDEKEFKSINQGDLDLMDEKEEEEFETKEKESKSLLKSLKKALKDNVSDVKLSKRLKDSPVCLISGEGVSMEMEKVLSKMPQGKEAKAQKILEINPNHELFKTLDKIYKDNKKDVPKYAKLLYNQALLIEGLPLENPNEFSKLMTELIIEKNKK